MSDMNPEGVKIKFRGKEYGLIFTFRAIDNIQSKFNRSIAELPQIMGDPVHGVGGTVYIYTTLINEGLDCLCDDTGAKTPHIAEDYVARHAHESARIQDIQQAIYKAFLEHTQIPTEGDDDPNPKSE